MHKKEKSEILTKADQAKEKLIKQYKDHPDISLIDLGRNPTGKEKEGRIVIRIHVRKHWTMRDPEDRMKFSEEIDGIPVEIVTADYELH